eukprot:TRINITY_DN51251_c0_g1_i1.p1 TRINITY_DN51251_c0_g1~~TRINITY_DN51251_c0_g1_i1.p1  ORF type:complete len:282 (-),score=45.17 TRINITY_DN51251_c0_g1_i1:38-883(-)
MEAESNDLVDYLEDHYTIGNQIGDGAFAHVHTCTSKDTGAAFAVKLFDESVIRDDIAHEATMLKDLVHETICPIVDLYLTKAGSSCIVMKLYHGGDMITGMQKQFKEKGSIPCTAIKPIMSQVLQPIEYIHSKQCAHLCIKGDNYFLDHVDITAPECRVVLGDFGTVTKVSGRLSKDCGTKFYWAPERFDADYTEIVDEWGAGVILFGLRCGRFPFKGERPEKKLEKRFLDKFDDDVREVLLGLLEIKESERLSATAALNSRWIARKAVLITVSEVVPDVG